jgi:hypothetical protein
VVSAAVLLLIASIASADERDALARARQLYNTRDFEGAIAAADEAARGLERADRADLIAARALLERYRLGGTEEHLAKARERLRRINPHPFGFAERLEYVIGLGEALFFEQATGAAAGVFESLLVGPDTMPADSRERVLDWWASSMDRDARPQPDIERRILYQRVLDRMGAELANNPSSSVAAYWVSAAAHGQGDLRAAWDAAQAGWVRAPMTADGGLSLRSDLDNLVQRGIVPDRARQLGQPPEMLIKEWEDFKARWAKAD